MTPEQIAAVRALCDAVIAAVTAAGSHGAPAGVMYSALMAHGCSLTQFQSLMRGLIAAGKVKQNGQLYFLA